MDKWNYKDLYWMKKIIILKNKNPDEFSRIKIILKNKRE